MFCGDVKFLKQCEGNFPIFMECKCAKIMNKPEITWIDVSTWARKTHFQSFTSYSKCLIHATKRLDMDRFYTLCKKSEYRLFPATVAAVAHAANQIPEFRMVISPENGPGIWNFISPVYSIFHDDDKTFSSICSPYDDDIKTLYQIIVSDIDRYKNVKGHIVTDIPQNILPTSCEADLDFTSFHIQPIGEAVYMQLVAPTIIWGKMTDDGGRKSMPLTVSINHAAADGYHISRFFKIVQELFDCEEIFN